MTLLIVDDEYRIGQLISQLIHYEENDLELIGVFDDSEKAFGAILLHHPDIVISDIKMPVIDGLELVRKTQAEGLKPHFVFVSGFREFEYAHKALQYGVEDYLLKPVKQDELNAILSKISAEQKQNAQEQQKKEKLQAEVDRARHVQSPDLLQAIDSSKGEFDWANMNRLLQTHVDADRRMQAIVLRLDYYDSTLQDDIQDRMVINNLISMAESRMRPYASEQIYAVQNKTQMVGLLNYSSDQSENIHQELYTVYTEIKKYLTGFPEYAVTLAIGDETAASRIRQSLAQARHRLDWRIVLGINRMICDQQFNSDKRLAVLDAQEQIKLRNAVEALNVEQVQDIWAQHLSAIQNDPANDPALYYSLCNSFLTVFYENLVWNDRRSQQSRIAIEGAQHCWQLTQLNDYVLHIVSEELALRQNDLEHQAGRPVRIVLDYISENYAEKISLEEIAETLQMNTSYLSTLFKKETGKNFQTYLTEYRIERAKELLRTTNDTMLHIASQVGYQDVRYFSQSFVKIVGVKPSLYRKMYF